MKNPVKDLDTLIDELTNLKRAINKFNRNSPIVQVHNMSPIVQVHNMSAVVHGAYYLEFKKVSNNDYLKLTDRENYILETNYTTEHHYNKKKKMMNKEK